MPIISLQQDATPQFEELGRLRKGDVKPKNGKRPGSDLGDTFRFIGSTPAIQQEFDSVFPVGNVNHLEAILPYDTVDENFGAWMMEYTQSGSLKKRCDGQSIHWMRGNDGRGENCSVPCVSDGGGCKCVQDAKLYVFLDKLDRFGYVTIMTSSSNDIAGVTSQMLGIAQIATELGRTSLAGMPIIIGRKPRKITVPKDGGGTMRVEKSLLYIEPHPKLLAELRMIKQARMRRLQSQDVTLPVDDIDFGTGEIQSGGFGDDHGGATDAANYVATGMVDESIWRRFDGSSDSAKMWALETGAFDSPGEANAALKNLYNRMKGALPDATTESLRDALLGEWVEQTLSKLDPDPDFIIGDVSEVDQNGPVDGDVELSHEQEV